MEVELSKAHDICIGASHNATWNFVQQRYANNNNNNKLPKMLRIEAHT